MPYVHPHKNALYQPQNSVTDSDVDAVQWFRLYMGVYKQAFPDVSASLFPQSFTSGSRMHINPQCTSAAVAYTAAKYSMVPAGVGQ